MFKIIFAKKKRYVSPRLWLVKACLLLTPSLGLGGTSLPNNIEYSTRTLRMQSFPCEACHKSILFKDKTKVKHHSRIENKHLSAKFSCFTCHNPKHMETLNIVGSDDTTTFDRSFKNCLGCHGDKKKDFYLGMHGKDVGKWQGKRIRLQCVDCHNPHNPHSEKVIPIMPPKFPKRGIKKDHH